MNQGTKIDINGTLDDAFNSTAESIIGLFVVVALFGCLVAPYFSFLFEKHYIDAYNVYRYPLRNNLVKSKMIKVKIALWIVSIFTWTIVLLLHSTRHIVYSL